MVDGWHLSYLLALSGITARPGVQKAISGTVPVIHLFTHL